MRMTALVISEQSGQFNSKSGLTKYQELALLDMDPAAESRLVNTVDYRLSEDEKLLHAGKLLGRTVIVDVKDLAIFNNRLQIKRGHLVEVKASK